MVVFLRENRLQSLSCAFDKTNSDLDKDSCMSMKKIVYLARKYILIAIEEASQ